MPSLAIIKTSIKVFCTSSAISNEEFNLRNIANSAATSCLAPLNLLGEKIWGGASTFIIKNPHVLKLEKTPSSTSYRAYIVAAIFFIPGFLIGASIKLVILVVSPVFRQQFRSVVNYYHPELKTYESFISREVDALRDPLVNLSQFLSFEDIGVLFLVDKTWHDRANFILAEKIKEYYQRLGSDKNVEISLLFSRVICPDRVVKALGIEQTVALPSYEDLTALFSEVQRSKKNKILRMADFSAIMILTTCADAKSAGALVFQTKPHITQITSLGWTSLLGQEGFLIDYDALTHQQMLDLLKGQTITVLKYSSDLSTKTPVSIKITEDISQ